jgi:hypothetical protein
MGYQIPGYQIALPPRYVVPFAASDTKASTSGGKIVQFADDATKTIEIPRVPQEYKVDVWYDNWDYLKFKMKYCASASCEHVVTSTYSFSSLIPSMFFRKSENAIGAAVFASAIENRQNFARAVLKHQADCRSQGYSDPEGLHLISRALSKTDRASAWRLGLDNAEEVVCFTWQEDQPSLPSLFLDFYLDTVHPFLNSPLEVLNRIVCEVYD